MIDWLRSLFLRRSERPHDIEPTMTAMRETRALANDLKQGKSVSSQRFREVEAKLTGHIIEDHLTGAATRVTRRGV